MAKVNTNKIYENMIARRNHRLSAEGYKETLMQEMDIIQSQLPKLVEGTPEYKKNLRMGGVILREMLRVGIEVVTD